MNELLPDHIITPDSHIHTLIGKMSIREYGIVMLALGFVIGFVLSGTEFENHITNKPDPERPLIK